MFRLFLIVCFVAVFAVSCSDSPVNTNDNAKQIWPMEVGNYWKYKVYSVYKGTEKFMYDLDYYISGKITISGSEWSVISSGDRPATTIYINKPDGLWFDRLDTIKKENTPELHIKYKYPTKAGDIMLWGEDTVTTAALNISVEAPAGKFKCVHYFARINHEDNFYVCPGIGLVKHKLITAYDEGEPVWIEWRLVEYKVK